METVTQNPSTTEPVAQVAQVIAQLAPNAKHADIINALNAVIAQLAQPAPTVSKRDRGPKSTREMTEADARLVILGDMKDTKTKEAAAKLGLSYGQVYSARFGFTHKNVYKEAVKAGIIKE